MNGNQFDLESPHALCIVNSRIKIVIFLILLVVPIFLNEIKSLTLIFALLLAVSAAFKIRISVLFAALKKISLFVVFVVVLNLTLGSGGAIARFSLRAFQSGLVAALKVIDLYFAVTVFIVTTSRGQVAQGTASILKPFSKTLARKAALYGFVVMGFVPIFAEEVRRIQIVQRFRRGSKVNSFMAKVRGAPTIIVPLIISALNRSSQLAAIVELREVESKLPYLVPAEKPAPRDYLWLVIVPLIVALSLLIQSI